MTPEQREKFAATLRDRLGNDPQKLLTMFAGGPNEAQVEEARPARSASPGLELMKRLGMVAEVLVDGGTTEAQGEIEKASAQIDAMRSDLSNASNDAINSHRQACDYATMLGLTNANKMRPQEMRDWLFNRCKSLRAAGDSVPKTDRRESPVDVLIGLPAQLDKLKSSGDAASMGKVLAQVNEIVTKYGGETVIERVRTISDALDGARRQCAQELKNIEVMREQGMKMAAILTRIGTVVGLEGQGMEPIAVKVESILDDLQHQSGLKNATFSDISDEVGRLRKCHDELVAGG